jgi:ribonuclease inhibitor
MQKPFIPKGYDTVDFTGAKNYGDIYPLIKKGLQVPQRLGENKDALWDIITGYINTPVEITIKGVSSLTNKLQGEIEDILAVFDDAMKKYPDEYLIVYEK